MICCRNNHHITRKAVNFHQKTRNDTLNLANFLAITPFLSYGIKFIKK